MKVLPPDLIVNKNLPEDVFFRAVYSSSSPWECVVCGSMTFCYYILAYNVFFSNAVRAKTVDKLLEQCYNTCFYKKNPTTVTRVYQGLYSICPFCFKHYLKEFCK